ncbi:MAG: hypothetical protein AB7O96_13230 [Pseudobdellovibrionaceae bacterium]
MRVMSKCPKCNSPIEADFGVVACVSCSAVLFFDMDGVPHLNTNDPLDFKLESSIKRTPANLPPVPELDESESGAHFPSQEELAAQMEQESLPPIPDMQDGYGNYEMTPESEEHQSPELNSDGSEPFQDESAQAEYINEDYAANSQEFLQVDEQQEIAEVVEEVVRESAGSFADVERFANSEQSEGDLVYTIRIQGIDTEKIRHDLESVLTDARLFRDLARVLGEIKRGALVIEDLSAVKAAVILQRIKALPVEISWSQNAKSANDVSA